MTEIDPAIVGAADRLELVDTLAAGDGQDWYDFWSNIAQRQTAEAMYGPQADALLESSWLADRERAAVRRENERVRTAVTRVLLARPEPGVLLASVSVAALREAMELPS